VTTRCAIFSAIFALAASKAAAQAPRPAAAPPPPLRRWFELQTLTASTRYRFIESNADVVTANQMQYREIFRARFNLDAKHRYTATIGGGSGNAFISAWNNTGAGTGTTNFHDHYMKELYAAAQPVDGLELQYGGMYVTRGETTEYTSYDEDGYLLGERVSVRRPKELFLDEFTVTRAAIGPYNVPNLHKRWDGLKHPDYCQVLGDKRINQYVAASFDYSTQAGADTLRGAIALRFKPSAPISALRYEQYGRVNAHAAAGFAVTAERPLPRGTRLLGGYATVDQFYNGWNSDRIQRGRRVFALANVPIVGPLSAQLFVTQALHSPYPVAIRTRFDAIVIYDVAAALRQTGVF
jgi:hypothetical protein